MKKFDLNFYSGKRVLVTGHTGFKGTWLCRLLLNMGAQVTGYSLQPPTEPSIFGLAGMDRQMNSITGDIRNLDRLLEVFRENRPEIVLHLAAQPIVRESYLRNKCNGNCKYTGMYPSDRFCEIIS